MKKNRKKRDYIATLEDMLVNLDRINREFEAVNDPDCLALLENARIAEQ